VPGRARAASGTDPLVGDLCRARLLPLLVAREPSDGIVRKEALA
jgi:hypothetical protein